MLVRLRCSFQYPFNDGVSIHSLGFAFEVEKHTVAERSVGYGPNVFAGDMQAIIQQCPDLSTDDEGLSTSWT